MSGVVELSWRRREPPLAPSAVAAQGYAVAALSVATRERLVDGAELRVSTGPDWFLVLGDSTDLPWSDGVTYLGWDDGLLVPTTQACSPGADLVRAALLALLPADPDRSAVIALIGADVLVTALPIRPADPEQLVVATR
jgi:MoxR-vWA-beta-propeller ternary system domain bpX5